MQCRNKVDTFKIKFHKLPTGLFSFLLKTVLLPTFNNQWWFDSLEFLPPIPNPRTHAYAHNGDLPSHSQALHSRIPRHHPPSPHRRRRRRPMPPLRLHLRHLALHQPSLGLRRRVDSLHLPPFPSLQPSHHARIGHPPPQRVTMASTPRQASRAIPRRFHRRSASLCRVLLRHCALGSRVHRPGGQYSQPPRPSQRGYLCDVPFR